jgi:hypothetical protein
MGNELFRKKSMDKISSPDQLTDYIRVTNPGVWMVLAAILILLMGTCVWGVFGRLETRLSVAAVSNGEAIICYVPEENAGSVKVGMPIVIDGVEYTINQIADEPSIMTDNYEQYILHIGNLEVGQWVYKVNSDSVLKTGIYSAYIVTDRVSPLSFVFN